MSSAGPMPDGGHASSPDILVIGAGIAGIAAAARLVRLGFQKVTVLEASQRIGGRIQTAKIGNGWVEMGAQWIHGEDDNIAYDYATRHGLICDAQKLRDYELKQLRFQTNDALQIDDRLCHDMFQKMSAVLEDIKTRTRQSSDEDETSNSTSSENEINLERYLDERMADELATSKSPYERELKTGLLEWFKKHQCSVDGCDSLSEMSTESFSYYRECDGNQLTNLKKGYSAVVHHLAKDIPESSIVYGKCVTRVETMERGNSPSMRVTCADGSHYDVDHVVVTVSLGVLKHNVDTMFEPPLSSAKKQAILEMGFGTVSKIFLEFERSFWPTNSSGYNLIWTSNPSSSTSSATSSVCPWSKDVFCMYSVPFASNVLCGWVSGEAARQMENLDDDSEVTKALLDLLRRFTGKAELPKVLNVVRSGWSCNPYTKGSYSYLKSELAEPKLANDVIAEPVYMKDEKDGRMFPVLMFAGEATHPYYYSTVHGAWESGEREANRIAQFYSSSARSVAAAVSSHAKSAKL